jgi:hypothetical protein
VNQFYSFTALEKAGELSALPYVLVSSLKMDVNHKLGLKTAVFEWNAECDVKTELSEQMLCLCVHQRNCITARKVKNIQCTHQTYFIFTT